jgi:hypothetical protein
MIASCRLQYMPESSTGVLVMSRKWLQQLTKNVFTDKDSADLNNRNVIVEDGKSYMVTKA